MLIDFGINFNRPITYRGKVGTFLDIALYRYKQLEGIDAVNLGTSIRKLKKLKFKTCKELSIKCSIDT